MKRILTIFVILNCLMGVLNVDISATTYSKTPIEDVDKSSSKKDDNSLDEQTSSKKQNVVKKEQQDDNKEDVSDDHKEVRKAVSEKQSNQKISKAQYATIVSKGFDLLKDLTSKEVVAKSDDYYQQTFLVKKKEVANQQNYYALYQDNKFIGYAEEHSLKLSNYAYGAAIKKNDQQYATINEKGFSIYRSLTDFSNIVSNSNKLYAHTYLVNYVYSHYNGTKYAKLVNNQNKFIGFIDINALKFSNNRFGSKVAADDYAFVKTKNGNIYNDLTTLEIRGKTSSHYQKTLKNSGYYITFDNKKYYSLRDENDKWVGYFSPADLTITSYECGVKLPVPAEQKYATVAKKGWRIWETIAPFANVLHKSEDVYGKTYQITAIYHHSNGNEYGLLVDKNNTKIGYANLDMLKMSQNSYGSKVECEQYATVKNSKGIIYNDLKTLEKRGSTSKYYNKTVENSGMYTTFDGRTFYSLRDNNDKWIGYFEAKDIKVTTKAYGVNLGAPSSKKYATLVKEGWRIWGCLDPFEDVRYTTTEKAYKTYRISAVYSHFNGDTYYSLRNSEDKWVGYVNAGATVRVDGPKGKAKADNRIVKVNKKGYKIWKNIDEFEDVKTTSDKQYGNRFIVKYTYKHYNGSQYYSLYDENDKWYGYINANAMVTKRYKPTYFNQNDSRWGYKQYGKWNFATTGCVPTCMAMAFTPIKEKTIYPDQLGSYLYNNSSYFNKVYIGIDARGCRWLGDKYGVNTNVIKSKDEMIKLLKSGAIVNGMMGTGYFAEPGYTHGVIFYGYKDGKTYAYDPYSKSKNGWYSVSKIYEQQSNTPEDHLDGSTWIAYY